MGKLVSVIIPTHLGSEKIYEAVKSVLSQTYKNIEIIVIDDNGKDSKEQKLTENVMNQFKENLNLHYLIHDYNINGSSARNTGIKFSEGEYIAFLDDDDIYFPDCIQIKVDAFNELSSKYGLVMCSFKQVRKGFNEQYIKQNIDGNILYKTLVGEIESPSSILMIKREIIEEIGLWNETFFRHQDWEFISRLSMKYDTFSINEVLVQRNVYWRHAPTNPEKYEKYRLHFLNNMKELIKTLEEDQITNIYDHHYSEIGKSYFKNKKIIKSMKYLMKTTHPMKRFITFFYQGLKYLQLFLKF